MKIASIFLIFSVSLSTAQAIGMSKELIKNISQVDPCMKAQFQLCGHDFSKHQECLQNAFNKLPPLCQARISYGQQYNTHCKPDFDRLCPMDMTLFSKDQEAFNKQQSDCRAKVREKVNPKCREAIANLQDTTAKLMENPPEIEDIEIKGPKKKVQKIP